MSGSTMFGKIYFTDSEGNEREIGTTCVINHEYKSDEWAGDIKSLPEPKEITMSIKMPPNDFYRKRKGKRYIAIPYFNYNKWFEKIFRNYIKE